MSQGKSGTLTLVDLILMGLANIVGAGVFVILGKSVKYGGNMALLALFVVSMISLLMGFCYIEIYSRFKSSITEFLAIQHTMGETAGQTMLYLIYLFAIFSGATIVISISKYLSSFGALSSSPVIQTGISILLLCLMSYINYQGIETSKMVANTISVAMLIILGTLIALSAKFVTWEKAISGPSVPWDSFVLSAVLSLFLFNGYDFLVKISDESVDPENNKTALVASISITTLIYLAIIVCGLCVLNYKTASTTFNMITKMYEVLTNNTIASIVFIIGAFIMFNTAFLSVMSATKFMQGLGNDKKIAFPEFWAKANENGSPTNAIYVSLAITILLAILNNEVLLAVFTNTSCILILGMLSVALLMLRWKERNDPDAQNTHNYIYGNINNIPIPVVINLAVLVYVMAIMIRDKFWIGKV
jgi:basic amino acid/polyamine antiporter, APA family